jgi:hypothetical protein
MLLDLLNKPTPEHEIAALAVIYHPRWPAAGPSSSRVYSKQTTEQGPASQSSPLQMNALPNPHPPESRSQGALLLWSGSQFSDDTDKLQLGTHRSLSARR